MLKPEFSLKNYRLSSRKSFDLIHQKGVRWSGESLKVFVSPAPDEHTRVAFIIRKKIGCACKRNRIKRSLRQLFFNFASEIRTPCWVLVHVQKPKDASASYSLKKYREDLLHWLKSRE